jgi:hypothetical protein
MITPRTFRCLESRWIVDSTSGGPAILVVVGLDGPAPSVILGLAVNIKELGGVV